MIKYYEDTEGRHVLSFSPDDVKYIKDGLDFLGITFYGLNLNNLNDKLLSYGECTFSLKENIEKLNSLTAYLSILGVLNVSK